MNIFLCFLLLIPASTGYIIGWVVGAFMIGFNGGVDAIKERASQYAEGDFGDD